MSKDLTIEHFKPEQFELVSFTEKKYSLDREVAAKIANIVWANDVPGQKFNNFPEDTPFIVDPECTGQSHAPQYAGVESAGAAFLARYKASFDIREGKTPIEDSNRAFGRAVQQALDIGERRHRIGITKSAMYALSPAAISVGSELAINGSGTETELIVGALGGLITAAGVVKGSFNLYRRAVTSKHVRPLNKPHLAAAEQYAASLGLPPVVTRS